MEALKDYTVHIDSKKRITLQRGTVSMKEQATPESISTKTLKSMDSAIQNFKSDKVSAPIDLSDLQ